MQGLKRDKDSVLWSSLGRAFHNWGATMEKALLLVPRDESVTRGTQRRHSPVNGKDRAKHVDRWSFGPPGPKMDRALCNQPAPWTGARKLWEASRTPSKEESCNGISKWAAAFCNISSFCEAFKGSFTQSTIMSLDVTTAWVTETISFLFRKEERWQICPNW